MKNTVDRQRHTADRQKKDKPVQIPNNSVWSDGGEGENHRDLFKSKIYLLCSVYRLFSVLYSFFRRRCFFFLFRASYRRRSCHPDKRKHELRRYRDKDRPEERTDGRGLDGGRDEANCLRQWFQLDLTFINCFEHIWALIVLFTFIIFFLLHATIDCHFRMKWVEFCLPIAVCELCVIELKDEL